MPSDDLWNAYTKGVKKIRRTKKFERQVQPPSHNQLREGKQTASPTPCPSRKDGRGALTANPSLAHLDRRLERDLRQGDIDIEARIDLHGMTQEKAYNALAHFIAAQIKAGRRRLLVITGKGKGNQGALRTNLPLWLQALPDVGRILALRPAAPKHGGDGAFYVLLKKNF